MTTLYQEGASDVEVRCALAIPPARALSHQLWMNLQDDYPSFSEAVNYGRALAESWWNRKARQGLLLGEGVKFNTTLWIVNMRHRFNFKGAERNQAPPDDSGGGGVTFYIPQNGRQKSS